jgi:hypothetical protein
MPGRKLVVEVVADPRNFTRGLVSADRSAKAFTKDMETMGRGVLSGTAVFKGFGRSLAFASGGFLAFAGGTRFLEDSIKVAREAAVSQRQLAAQMKASGDSFQANKQAIDKAELSLEKYGFTSEDSAKALTVLERGTGNIQKAIELQGTAADLARAKNLDLASAANVLAKVFGGQETALRRAVPGLDKEAHGLDLIQLAQAKLAGQAAAATTPQERFAATLHETQRIIGTGLLPTLDKFLTSLSKWLQRMNETGQTQKAVTSAVQFLKDAFTGVKTAVTPLIDAFKVLQSVTGGTKNAVQLLVIAFGTFKFSQLLAGLGRTASAIGLIGTKAATSEGEVAGLQGSLAGLSKIAIPTIVIPIAYQITQSGPYKAVQGFISSHLGGAGAAIAASLNPFSTLKYLRQNIPKLFGGGDAQKVGQDSANAFSSAFLRGFKTGLQGTQPIADAFGGFVDQFKTAAAKAGKAIEAAAPKGPSVELRNTWFDQMISRQLDIASGIPALKDQVAAYTQVAALIQQQIDKTKDITRKQNLMDQLRHVNLTILEDQQQIAQQATDAAKALSDQAKQDAQAARAHEIAVSQLAISRADATKGAEDDLLTRRHLVEVLKQQLAADRTNVDLQQQLSDAEQAVKDKVKEQADAAKQTKIDAASLALQRADLTDSLSDNLAAAINQVQVLKKTGAAESDIVAAQLTVKGYRDQIRQQAKDEKDKAKQDKLDAADLAIQRADLTKTLSDNLAAEIHKLAVLKKTGATESAIVAEMVTIKGLKQQQAQATKDAAKAAKETAAAARQAAQFARLGFGPTGDVPLPSTKVLQKRLGRLEDAVQGTVLDTPRMQARLNHLRQVLSGSLGKVGSDVRSKIKEIMDGITQQLQNKKPKARDMPWWEVDTDFDKFMRQFEAGPADWQRKIDEATRRKQPRPVGGAAGAMAGRGIVRGLPPGTVGGAAGAAAGRGIAPGFMPQLPRDVTGAVKVKPTVVVNQYFQAPTKDKHREARYARMAFGSAFDQ